MNKLKPYKNKDWLVKQHINNRLTLEEIAVLCDVHPRTIRRYLNKFNILKNKYSKRPYRRIPKHIRRMFMDDIVS
jgi:hypothetical protein